MKEVLLFFKSIGKEVILAFILSTAFIFLMDFCFLEKDEIFPKAHFVGMFLYNVALAIVAASIFYIFTIHYKEHKEKAYIYPYVKDKLESISKQGEFLFIDLAKSAHVKLESKFPNEKELTIICEKIPPYSSSRLEKGIYTGQYFKWVEYFDIIKRKSKEYTSQILNLMKFLDPDLIGLLKKFEENGFFNGTESYLIYSFANNNLTQGHQEYLIKYIDLLDEIENYIKEKMKAY